MYRRRSENLFNMGFICSEGFIDIVPPPFVNFLVYTCVEYIYMNILINCTYITFLSRHASENINIFAMLIF